MFKRKGQTEVITIKKNVSFVEQPTHNEMKTFFTNVAAFIAGVAIAAEQNEADYCCELFTEEDFGGQTITVCLGENFWGEINRMTSDSVHFNDCEGDETECTDGVHFMTNNMESYRCGIKVNASFCEGDITYEWNYGQLGWDHVCEE